MIRILFSNSLIVQCPNVEKIRATPQKCLFLEEKTERRKRKMKEKELGYKMAIFKCAIMFLRSSERQGKEKLHKCNCSFILSNGSLFVFFLKE